MKKFEINENDVKAAFDAAKTDEMKNVLKALFCKRTDAPSLDDHTTIHSYEDALEALAIPEVCYGAPNLYFLFAAMGIKNLKDDAEMVYIIPRSWTSGAYFEKFRKFLFSHACIEYIHLFESRNKVFDKESVLQETMIVKFKKNTRFPSCITISTSATNKDFSDLHKLDVPYQVVVSDNHYYVHLVTDEEEVKSLQSINHFKNTLVDLGLKMKTGLVVDFRY